MYLGPFTPEQESNFPLSQLISCSFIVLKSLEQNILMRSTHTTVATHVYCDQHSKGKIQEFKASCPCAREDLNPIPSSVCLI